MSVTSPAHRLVLFDIDGTLIASGGAGRRAMIDAGRAIHGPDFHAEGVEFAGRLDPLILADMLRANGRPATQGAMAELRARYARELPRHAAMAARALPGATELIGALRARASVTIGLLTGNFADTARVKLTACAIDPSWFTIGVWGDDSPHDPPARRDLPPVARARFAAATGSEIDPRHMAIIGDTPDDVSCAATNGCRSLAVATGAFGVDLLARAGADRVVPDLSDTASVLGWLLDLP